MKKIPQRISVRIAAFLLMIAILCCSPAYAKNNFCAAGQNGEDFWAVDRICSFTDYDASGQIPINIEFRIKMIICAREDGSFAISDYVIYPVKADEQEKQLYLAYRGRPTIGYQDGYRVMRVTQVFDEMYDHTMIGSRSYSAFVYFNRLTGDVSLKSL